MKRMLLAFGKRTDGSATVEIVIWLPFLILFFVLTAEISNIFFAKTKMEQIVADANRLFSVGVLDDQDELEEYVLAQLSSLSSNASYSASIGSQLVTGVATLPISDVLLTSFFGDWFDFSISSSATQYIEY